MSTWDVVVVGAGPAGSMTALEVARAGASVLLVDRVAHPRWKVCGACLSPGTQQLLREAGVAGVLARGRASPLHTLRLGGWGTQASVPLGPSVALGRAVLDLALIEAAVAAGATFRAPARARLGPCYADGRAVRLEEEGRATELRARVLVAADGLGSPVLAQALAQGGTGPRATGPASAASRVGLGGVFRPGSPAASGGDYPPGHIHMAVGERGYVGLVRLEDGSLDVAAALDAAALGRAGPHGLVSEILAGAGFAPLGEAPETGWRGTPKLTRRPDARAAERVFAVGDAAGYVEPFTGEGIAWALAGARALAPIATRAAEEWSPELADRWEAEHARVVGRSALLCRGVAWGLRRAWLARSLIRLLGHAPAAATPAVRWAARPPAAPVGGLA